MYRHNHGVIRWGYRVMVLVMPVLPARIILAVVVMARYVRRASHHTPTPPPRKPPPEQVPAERLARGENGAEDHRRRLGPLRSGPGPTTG